MSGTDTGTRYLRGALLWPAFFLLSRPEAEEPFHSSPDDRFEGLELRGEKDKEGREARGHPVEGTAWLSVRGPGRGGGGMCQVRNWGFASGDPKDGMFLTETGNTGRESMGSSPAAEPSSTKTGGAFSVPRELTNQL